MADVIQKVITANAIKNGDAVVRVNEKVPVKVLSPQINKVPDTTSVEAEYTNRFDDVDYYR